jgi:hypothetical protein
MKSLEEVGEETLNKLGNRHVTEDMAHAGVAPDMLIYFHEIAINFVKSYSVPEDLQIEFAQRITELVIVGMIVDRAYQKEIDRQTIEIPDCIPE